MKGRQKRRSFSYYLVDFATGKRIFRVVQRTHLDEGRWFFSVTMVKNPFELDLTLSHRTWTDFDDDTLLSFEVSEPLVQFLTSRVFMLVKRTKTTATNYFRVVAKPSLGWECSIKCTSLQHHCRISSMVMEELDNFEIIKLVKEKTKTKEQEG